MQDEGTWMLAMAQGDESALQSLYARYERRVFHTCWTYLLNREEAEEAVQDVFIEVFRTAARFEGRASVSTWIYRITTRKCLDRLRHRKRQKRFAFLTSLWRDSDGTPRFEPPDPADPSQPLERTEQQQALYRAIATLPDNQKTAFILAFVDELPRAEVAEVLGMSLKATESLLMRAKANLRKELEKFYPGPKDSRS